MSYKEAELNQLRSLVVRLSLAGHKIYLLKSYSNWTSQYKQVWRPSYYPLTQQKISYCYKEAELNQLGSLVVRLSLAGHKIYLLKSYSNWTSQYKQVWRPSYYPLTQQKISYCYKEAELNQLGSLVVRLSLAGHKIYLLKSYSNWTSQYKQVWRPSYYPLTQQKISYWRLC